MISELGDNEIDMVSGGALEGAAATAGLLGIGFAALGFVATAPISGPIFAAGAVVGVLGIGFGYFGAVYGGDPPTGKNAHVKPV